MQRTDLLKETQQNFVIWTKKQPGTLIYLNESIEASKISKNASELEGMKRETAAAIRGHKKWDEKIIIINNMNVI